MAYRPCLANSQILLDVDARAPLEGDAALPPVERVLSLDAPMVVHIAPVREDCVWRHHRRHNTRVVNAAEVHEFAGGALAEFCGTPVKRLVEPYAIGESGALEGLFTALHGEPPGTLADRSRRPAEARLAR